MPSLQPGFEYDIFISYRHKDNKGDHWVTEFVKALRAELDATFKDEVSIYFDENPHDGLLETHNVDKSLEGKLKCLVFIPIISQTYCDPKSFAWQHEFCAFNKSAKEDEFGRDIKLGNGNVASRILPVKIHDLDGEDKTLIERELGGVLRAIDFIFRSSGVNRPLTPTDKREENLNRSFYRDQINKVANAIKEITSAVKSKNQASVPSLERLPNGAKKSSRVAVVSGLTLVALIVSSYFLYSQLKSSEQESPIDKSIAVLPFADMSPGHDQEYLGDGIAEDIITTLSRIQGLKVIGRTSSFQFKGEKADLREIGDKLNVATLLEGSVMKSGNTIRITAQLINVSDGSHIWAERYDRSIVDIFSIQDEISRMIAAKMKMTMLGSDNSVQTPTVNMDAYENVLHGMQLMNRGVENAKAALPFFEKAIQLDSNYLTAHEQRAAAYFFLPFTNEMSPMEAVKKIDILTEKLLRLNPNSDRAHEILFNSYYFYGWDWAKAEAHYSLKDNIDPRPTIGHALYRYDVYGDFKASEEEFFRLINQDPLEKEFFRLLGDIYERNQQHDKAAEALKRSIQIDPTFGAAYCDLGDVHLSMKDYTQAIDSYKKGEQLSPGYRNPAGHITALRMAGKELEAVALFNSNVAVTPGMRAKMCFAIGKTDEGFVWLEKAFDARDAQIIQFRGSSGFDPVRNDPRFIAMIEKLKLPDL